MVTLRKISNSEKAQISKTGSLPSYEEVMKQSEQYPQTDPQFSVNSKKSENFKKVSFNVCKMTAVLKKKQV